MEKGPRIKDKDKDPWIFSILAAYFVILLLFCYYKPDISSWDWMETHDGTYSDHKL